MAVMVVPVIPPHPHIPARYVVPEHVGPTIAVVVRQPHHVIPEV